MPVQRVTSGELTDVTEQTYEIFSKRRSVFLIYSSSAVLGCSIALFGALSTWIQSELKLSQTEAGFTQAVFFLGHLSGALLSGMTLSRWPLNRSWLFAVCCTMLGSFLCGSPSYALILCGRFLAGMGLSSTIILGTRTLGELFPNSSARALNLLHALIAATAALTFMTARQLAEAVDSWECSFLVTGLIALIPVSMAIFLPLKLNDFKPVSDELTEDSVDTGVKEPLKKSRWLGIDVLVLFPVVVGYVALEQSMSLFLPASVETRFGMSGSTAANMGALFWFGIILGRVTSSFLVEWIAEKRQFFWGAILMGVTLLLSLHIQNYPLMQVFVFLGGLFGGPLVPLGFATAAKQARHQGAQALIACQLSCCLGGITGPFGVGLLADNVGLVNSLSTYCALIIIAVLPLLFLMASSWLSWETVQRLLASTYKPLKSRSYEPVRPSQDRLTGYDQQAEPSTLSSHLRTHLPCEEEYASTSVTKC